MSSSFLTVMGGAELGGVDTEPWRFWVPAMSIWKRCAKSSVFFFFLGRGPEEADIEVDWERDPEREGGSCVTVGLCAPETGVARAVDAGCAVFCVVPTTVAGMDGDIASPAEDEVGNGGGLFIWGVWFLETRGFCHKSQPRGLSRSY